MAEREEDELPCSCVDLDTSVKAVGELSRTDWRELTPDAISEIWPGVSMLPCGQSELKGIEAVASGYRSCCESCSTCGGPAFYTDEHTGIPTGVAVQVCSRRPEEALANIRRLTDAVLPEETDASYGNGWPLPTEDDPARNGYRWQSHERTFVLDAGVGQFEEYWLGILKLTRCELRDAVLEEWELSDGSMVSVVELEVETSEEGERQLAFSYVSNCLINDRDCVSAERQELWPQVQTLADSEDVELVYFGVEDCGHEGYTSFPRRMPNGEWELPPW